MLYKLSVIVICLFIGNEAKSEAVIFPEEVDVFENTSLDLNCTLSQSEMKVMWKNSNGFGFIQCYNNNSYKIFGEFLISKEHLYRFFCFGNGNFGLKIQSVGYKKNGEFWQCGNDFNTSKQVTINVKVTVKSVVINEPNDKYMSENENQSITCNSSAGRPNPKVLWYLSNPNKNITYNLSQFSSYKFIPGDHGLTAVLSTLHFKPNRTVNEWRLYCEVWTRTTEPDIKSREIYVNVSYPPDNYPIIQGIDTNNVVPVIELDTGTFICSITGGNPSASLKWDCFGRTNITNEILENNRVTSTVHWKADRSRNACSCKAEHINNWQRVINITFNVQYPPEEPSFEIEKYVIDDVVRVIRNKTFQVVCKSNSKPNSNYTWTGPSLSGKEGDTLEIVNVQVSDQGEYKCKSTNRMIRMNHSYIERSNTSSFTLTTLYFSGTPTFRFDSMEGKIIESNNLNVVRNDDVLIYCDVQGNPNPNITWDTGSTGHLLQISDIFSDINRTCTATNLMKEIPTDFEMRTMSIASITVIVFYPPSIPTIHISNYKDGIVQVEEKTVSIIESDTVNLTCFSESRPLPSYEWVVSNRSTKTYSTNLMTFQNISRNETGTYTCKVGNIMVRSFGKREEGKNSTTMFLNILYPASVWPISNRSVVEGSNLEMPCPFIDGNPSNFTISWSRHIDKRLWNNTLFIQNISRQDDALYKCSVKTEMFPTIGKSLKIERSKTFHLNVFFPFEVKKFSVSTNSSERSVVINENGKAPFTCIAEANPISDMYIKNPRDEVISEISEPNIAKYTLYNASFIDAGEYICSGRNNYTSGSPISKLILIVKSHPRPANDDTSVMKVATKMHKDVTLQFVARNYLDEPHKTNFSWYMDNVTISDNDNKYIIQSNGLISNITIQNTTEQDLGRYNVNVQNSVGMYTHYYELKAIDKPEPLRDFQVINDSITDTSVTLAWTPGFNGGCPQKFVILYKIKVTAEWLNKSIPDNGFKNMNYTLNDLTSMQVYEIEMYAENTEGKSLNTWRLVFKTKARLASQMESQIEDKTGIIAGIAGSISAVVIVVVVIIGVVFFFRKRQTKNTDGIYQNVPAFGKPSSPKTKDRNSVKKLKRNFPQAETTFGEKSNIYNTKIDGEEERKVRNKTFNNVAPDNTSEGLQEVDDVPIILKERTEYCNSPEKIQKLDRITIAELYPYVLGNDDNLEAEYQKIPSGLLKPCTFARKPENIALNRYNGIYPYDHSRVKIQEYPEFFINACYIDGYSREKAYIASLGPTSKTTSDFKTFWQMVWHERSDMIVMLTNLHEPSGMKCEKYWPDEGQFQQYGDVIVTSNTFAVYAEYTVRTFKVSKENQIRSLTHLHYTAWPDKTVPEDVTSLLDFRKRMKDVPVIQNGPIIIHCSAGIGRTGTLIALDILIEEGSAIKSVNIFECVNNLRTQRVKMVQTLEQYIYIHKCLVNALSFDDETVMKEKISEYFDNKNDQHFHMQFQQLKLSVETDISSERKARLKNKSYTKKNRQDADVPGNRFNVYLNLTDGQEGSEYINAVYVNSFKKKDHFIVAQTPLQNTVVDFISLIYQEDCSCIATMENLKEPGMTVGTYIPEKSKKVIFGDFEVSCAKLEETSACVIRKMKIKYRKSDGAEKCIYHFQYKNWMTGSKTPVNATDFVQFVRDVEEYSNELGENKSRIVVHCLKANERSCLFCVVSIILEKLMVEGKVNITNIIRHLRTRRRTAVVSKEQLKFCYEAARAYVKMKNWKSY